MFSPSAIVRPTWGPQHFRRPRFIVDAASLDGTNDYALRGAGLTGAADSKVMLFSAWLKFAGGDGVPLRVITAKTGAASEIQALKQSDNTITFVFRNAAGTVIGRLTSASAYTVASGQFHVLASLDLATALGQLYVNDASDLAASPTLTNDTIDYTLAEWAIGADVAGANRLNADIAELYFNIAAALDLSVTANRRKFRRDDGKPEFLGNDGSIPTGTAPIIYQRLQDGEAAASFAINRGGGGGFTVTGALATAAASPSD